jgi:hypothetical protein
MPFRQPQSVPCDRMHAHNPCMRGKFLYVKPQPNEALTEMLRRDGELDRILDGRGLTFEPAVQVGPPPEPAETPTTIRERGRRYVETFAHGAFAGVDPARVKVNRDHVRERVIGRALRLDAWAEEGLTGTVRLARVREADEALALIDDDLLSVSAGFAPLPGGEEWDASPQPPACTPRDARSRRARAGLRGGADHRGALARRRPLT